MDGEPLGRPVEVRKKVTGVWRGCYGHGPRGDRPGFGPVTFTLKLKQGWTSHFTGSVVEDAPAGTPGSGAVGGYFNYPGVELTKQMPIGYVVAEDGSRKTLREFLAERGVALEQEPPGPPVLFQGRFLDSNRVQGTWLIQSQPIRLPNGKEFRVPAGAGYWCAEFVAENLEVNPGGGPLTELFDKSRLTAEEVADVEPPPPCCLGEFPVTEAEERAARLAAAEIYVSFDVNQAEEAQGAMPNGTMRIYVPAEDEQAAREILEPKMGENDEQN